MDAQRKSLQTLTASLDERRRELQEAYCRFGETLFADSAGASASAAALSPERVDSWRELMDARERDATSILDIKTAVTRRKEVEQFAREIAETSAALDAEYRERLADAGKAAYEVYDERYAPWFSAMHEKASAEGASLIDMELREETLKKELEETGFLGKMVAQLRLVGLAATVRRQRDRIAETLSDGVRTLVEGDGIEALRGSGLLEGKLLAGVDSIGETRERIRSLEARARSIDSEIAASAATLAAHGAESNPNRRLEELNARIREADRRLETLCALAARDYCDRFVDETGSPLSGRDGEASGFGDAPSYTRQLEEVSALRAGIQAVRVRIESLETAMKIDSLDRSMAAMGKTVEDCERKIASLEAQASALREALASAVAERKELLARKEDIDKTIT